MHIIGKRLTGEYLSRFSDTTAVRNAEVQSYLKESVDGIETIKSLDANKEVLTVFNKKFMNLLNHNFKGNLIFASQDVFITLVESIGTVLLLWYGVFLVIKGEMSIGALVTFYMLLSYFILPVKNMVELQPTIQKSLVAIDRLNDIFILKGEEDRNAFAKINKINKIEYKNIKFSYNKNQIIFSDLSLSISGGSKIAITGKSGSGKSTMAKLLLGFYKAEGTILINDRPLNEYSLADIRTNIVYVNQNTFLFASTILENILLGTEGIEKELIQKACELSGLTDWIEQLPMGLNTLLNENGLNLSSGQRQRIALARALVRQPEVIIFDEATCNLDYDTEKNILESIKSLSDITCIIISHKKEVIDICRQVYVLEHGTLIGG